MGCNTNCFQTTTDQCVEYTGQSDSSLGINQGDSVQQVLNQLVYVVGQLKVAVEQCTGDIDLGTLSTSSVMVSDEIKSVKLQTKGATSESATVKVNTTTSNIGVTYDIKAAVESVVGSGTLVKSRVSVEGMRNGGAVRLLSSDRLVSGFTLNPSNFPATLDIDARIQTGSGEKVVSKRINLNPAGQNTTSYLDVSEVTNSNIETQKEVNELLDTKVTNVENRVNELNNITLSSTGSLPNVSSLAEAITVLYSEVESLASDVTTLKGN